MTRGASNRKVLALLPTQELQIGANCDDGFSSSRVVLPELHEVHRLQDILHIGSRVTEGGLAPFESRFSADLDEHADNDGPKNLFAAQIDDNMFQCRIVENLQSRV